jgi:hypothetical protein
MARGAFDHTAMLAAVSANQWVDEDAKPHAPIEFNPYRVKDASEEASDLLPYDPAVLQQMQESR